MTSSRGLVDRYVGKFISTLISALITGRHITKEKKLFATTKHQNQKCLLHSLDEMKCSYMLNFSLIQWYALNMIFP